MRSLYCQCTLKISVASSSRFNTVPGGNRCSMSSSPVINNSSRTQALAHHLRWQIASRSRRYNTITQLRFGRLCCRNEGTNASHNRATKHTKIIPIYTITVLVESHKSVFHQGHQPGERVAYPTNFFPTLKTSRYVGNWDFNWSMTTTNKFRYKFPVKVKTICFEA